MQKRATHALGGSLDMMIMCHPKNRSCASMHTTSCTIMHTNPCDLSLNHVLTRTGQPRWMNEFHHCPRSVVTGGKSFGAIGAGDTSAWEIAAVGGPLRATAVRQPPSTSH